MNVGEWCEVENISFAMEIVHLLNFSSNLYGFSTLLLSTHHQCNLNQFYSCCRDESDFEIVCYGNVITKREKRRYMFCYEKSVKKIGLTRVQAIADSISFTKLVYWYKRRSLKQFVWNLKPTERPCQ